MWWQTTAAVVLVAALTGCTDAAPKHQKVLLTQVKTLTLSAGQHTTGRRSDPVPQMSCVRNCGKVSRLPATAQCYNRGDDGTGDVQWECKASLPDGVLFGEIQVTCEGYDFPEDPYILKGSCGLEYALEGSETRYSGDRHYSGQSNNYERQPYSSSSKGPSSLWILLIGAAISRRMQQPSGQSGHGGGRGGGGGGGGWGSGPDDAPPPPYDGPGSGGAGKAPPPYTEAPRAGNQGGGGFWQGMGLGAGLGYLARLFMGGGGYRRGGGYGYGTRTGAYGSYGSSVRTNTYRPTTSFSGASSSMSSRSTSGFGGTRRR